MIGEQMYDSGADAPILVNLAKNKNATAIPVSHSPASGKDAAESREAEMEDEGKDYTVTLRNKKKVDACLAQIIHQKLQDLKIGSSETFNELKNLVDQGFPVTASSIAALARAGLVDKNGNLLPNVADVFISCTERSMGHVIEDPFLREKESERRLLEELRAAEKENSRELVRDMKRMAATQRKKTLRPKARGDAEPPQR